MRLNKALHSFFILLLIFNLPSSLGQSIYKKYGIYRNPALVISNKISWTLSMGSGKTHFNHNLKNFYLYQSSEVQLIRSKNAESFSGDLISGQTNWLNNPTDIEDVNVGDLFDVGYDRLDSSVNNGQLSAQTVFLDGDTADFQFQSQWSSIPINFSAHYEFLKFRVGVGIHYEKLRTDVLSPNSKNYGILDYDPGFKTTKLYKYYGILGYKFFAEWKSALVGEIQIGNVKSSGEFNNDLMKSSLMVNLGLNYEYHFSEYLRFILKPSFEIKSYKMDILDASGALLDEVSHNYNAFYMQAGISINIPELRRSPLAADHVQLKHVIMDPKKGRLEEVRGQVLWKEQNPKMGQNHRRLIRNKAFNKKKISSLLMLFLN